MIDRRLNYGRHLVARYLREIAPFDTALDLGAGHGDDLRAARDACPDATLHGVECFEQYARELRAQDIATHDLNLERDKLPFDDGTVRVVIANQILEHVKEVFWVLHEVTRVLPVGGHLIVGVPNLGALHNRLLLAVGRQPSVIQNHSAHVRGYTKHDFLKLLETCFPGGYALQARGGSNFYPFPAPLAKPLAAALPGMAWGMFLLLRKTKPYDGGFLKHPTDARLETNFYLGA
jgi:SAM-dependent methyltransferase